MKGESKMNRIKTEQYIQQLIPLFKNYIHRDSFIYKYGCGCCGEEYVICTCKNFPFYIKKYYKKRVLKIIGERTEDGYKIVL